MPVKSLTFIAVITTVTWFASSSWANTEVDNRAITDEKEGANWLSAGRTYSEGHYSPLRSVNSSNVSHLGLAWFLELPGERTLEATPLAVDGVLYFSGMYGKTYAVDGRNGKVIWEFDPNSGGYRPDIFRRSGSAGGHRGVAYWRGKVYVGVIDGRLFALDGKTGKPVWNVQTFDEPDAMRASSGAPRVFNGKVIIGNSGDMGAMRGYVTAYDAETGRKLWRFFTVPGNPRNGFENPAMETAAKTWSGEWWRWGGGGAVWDSITYDPEFNRVYLGVGDPSLPAKSADSPDRGDYLFACSIVALDADTGAYVWHYQVNPHDVFGYDATQQMVLADLVVGGRLRKVLLQAPSNGFFYVIDRANGELISAKAIAKVTWADGIDLKSGRPIERPTMSHGENTMVLRPGGYGAHNWQSMAFNPATALVYLPIMKAAMTVTASTVGFNPLEPDDGTASLVAWDPIKQSARWTVHYPNSFWNGGALTTGGNLVFQGTGRGDFLAYDANTGKRLWSYNAGLGIIAAPIMYEVDGVEYVCVLVGYGGAVNPGGKRLFDYGWRYDEQPRRLLSFALGKATPLPPGKPPRYTVKALDDVALVIDSEVAAKGAKLYVLQCHYCHGTQLENTGSFAPDLRESQLALNLQAFKSVIHDGSLAAAGMPKFADLDDSDIRALYMYIRQRAREATH